MTENLARLLDLVDRSKLRIRVPRIPGFNDEENIRDSVNQIKESYGIDAEVFDYIPIPEIKKDSWLDDLDEDDEEE